MRKRSLIVAGIVTAAISLGACSAEPANSFAASMKQWNIKQEANKAYPNLKPVDAQKKYIQTTFQQRAAEMDIEQKRELAASFYAGFTLLNGQAIPEYCRKVGPYPEKLVERFQAINRTSEQSFNSVLTRLNMTREDLWRANERYLMSSAKNELMAASGLHGTYTFCKKLKEKPDLGVSRGNFSKEYPVIARAMNAPAQKAALR